MSDQFDLFDDPPAPIEAAVREAPAKPEEIAKVRAQLEDAFGDVLAGRSMFDMDEDWKARHGLSAKPAPAQSTTVEACPPTCGHVCGECANIKPTKFRKHEGVGFFCTESLDDARREAPSCVTHFEPRIGPCENCGPDVCEAFPCVNADPKDPLEIEAKQ